MLQRVELGLAGKEVDEKMRRQTDTFSMERKFLELMKRKLRKKRTIVEAARQVGSLYMHILLLIVNPKVRLAVVPVPYSTIDVSPHSGTPGYPTGYIVLVIPV